MMSERGRRGAGAPFYAPPRRKTSAEIISEARAAIYGEMSGATSGAGGGALRPLRTRRPFTPREPQRTLFAERAKKRDTRPPSAFDLKYLSLSETSSDAQLTAAGARIASLDDADDLLDDAPSVSNEQVSVKKPLRNQSRMMADRSGDSWGGFTKLPHLSGRSKPLHRRNTTTAAVDEPPDLSGAIMVTKALDGGNSEFNSHFGDETHASKSLSPESSGKRRVFTSSKSTSYDVDLRRDVVDISVKHLDVQLPTTSDTNYNNMGILELSESLCRRNQDSEAVYLQLQALLKAVQQRQPANSLRDLVLRSLYMHIDCDEEQVLVAVATIMFTIRVTGTHLAAACKLVFKIARNDKNDHFFRNSNLLELLVEGCGRADPLTEGECCVYGAGALRFLALDPRLCLLAHKAGALHLAALHMKILNNAKAENPRLVSEPSTHALYQLTGALRNLAGAGGEETRAFEPSGALAELVNTLLHFTDRDVLTNVARCLSVLSLEPTCCQWLSASALSARALLRALAACGARASLAVRLAYTLGNMAAADELARKHIYNEEGGVDVLLTILESYAKRNEHESREQDTDPDLHLIGSDLGGSDGSNEDVLIKTVRVVANLCLTESAGRGLAAQHVERAVRALLACLQLAERTDGNLESGVQQRREELAVAALATLNNITFYREPPAPPDPLDDLLELLCQVTCRWLTAGGAAACEAARALGNLSRSARAAKMLVLHGALDVLRGTLQHEDPATRCASAGVLVNVCGAGVECAGAARVAAGALAAAAAAGDAAAAALLARALWNAHAHRPLSTAHVDQATAALSMFIDDDSVFADCEASRLGDRRASDPEVSKHHVTFHIDNNHANLEQRKAKFIKAYSVDQDLHLEPDDLSDGCPEGEDCACGPCRRLAAWEELLAVAVPLLHQLRVPTTADVAVDTR